MLPQRTTLKKSLSHLSVVLAGPFLRDGPIAQPIEMRVSLWNPSFIHYRQVESRIAEQDHVYERNHFLFRSPDCAVHDPAAPQDAQAETADGRIRITKDVPMLWIDHISIEGVLLGVRQVSYGRECDPDSGEMNFS